MRNRARARRRYEDDRRSSGGVIYTSLMVVCLEVISAPPSLFMSGSAYHHYRHAGYKSFIRYSNLMPTPALPTPETLWRIMPPVIKQEILPAGRWRNDAAISLMAVASSQPNFRAPYHVKKPKY